MSLATPPLAPDRVRPPQPTTWSRILNARETPVTVVLIVVLVATSLMNSRFLAGQGRIDLMVSVSITALLAVGQTFVIVMKHVDLSIGSTLGLAGYVAADVVGPHGSLLMIFVVACAVGLAVGLVNGVLVATLRLPSLVVTLGTLYVVQGLLAVVASSRQVTEDQLPVAIVNLGETTLLGIPYLMWIAVIAAVVGGWYMHSRRPGRDLYAIGSNGPAALLVGIPVRRREILAFAISGLGAGMAGAMFLARFGGIDANAGLGYELPVIAACVVGGVSIAGGNGTILGAFVGALLLRAIGGSLSALDVPEFWQQAVNGTLLLLAITADRVASNRRERAAAREVVS
jgi:rhamnose transport system permease protein